jgi:hypothetical protein
VRLASLCGVLAQAPKPEAAGGAGPRLVAKIG